MANETKVLDTIEVADLEDNSKLTVVVQACGKVKTRSKSEPVVKEYPLPFNIEE